MKCNNVKLIVFSDLDGTLLDHDNYSWKAARPAMQRLQDNGFPLILNSSKTFSEMLKLSEKMDLHYPMICENGSVVAMNIDCDDPAFTPMHAYRLEYFARPYNEIVSVVERIKLAYGFKFTGFSQMNIDTIMDITGLNKESAQAASKREATEPLLWQDTNDKLEQFGTLLEKESLILLRGGRFYHVMSKVDKSDALNYVVDCYQRSSLVPVHTMALGDSYNDLKMLEVVNFPVQVLNKHIIQPDVSYIDNVRITSKTGPSGWSEAVNDVINILCEASNG